MATSSTAASSGSSPAPPSRDSRTRDPQSSRRLLLVIASNGMLRVAGGASSVLVGVYIADLANRGREIGAGLVGTLAAISFGAELLGAVPLGMLSDAVSARALMTSGAVLAGCATLLFGVSQDVSLFVVSRALDGLAAAAGVPALLTYLTDATAHDHRLRARAMSYFELSLLVGLALGGIVGGRLWAGFHTGAFAALALLYGVAALLLFVGSVGRVAHRGAEVWQGLRRALGTPQLQRLAPVWICMNAIIGLWLGPTLYFLLTNRSDGSQLLSGLPRRRRVVCRVRGIVRHGRLCLEPGSAAHGPAARASRVPARDARRVTSTRPATSWDASSSPTLQAGRRSRPLENALLPGSSSGRVNPMAWVTFTDPEVAQVGLTEHAAREQLGETISVARWDIGRVDRATCDDDEDGFIKLVSNRHRVLIGATIVAGRAGEMSGEMSLAIAKSLSVGDVATAVHAYPTYATALQQMTSQAATARWTSSRAARTTADCARTTSSTRVWASSK